MSMIEGKGKAMIFAAGIGSRLKPITNTKPKALVEFNGRTLLEYAILKLKYYGVSDIIINVHHFSKQIIDYVNTHDFGVRITISDESDELLDTGGGLLKAKDFFKDADSFIVYNVDVISTINLLDFYKFHISNNALVSLAVCKRNTSRYLLFDTSKQLCAWENTQSHEMQIIHEREEYFQLAFSGIQIISTKIFDLISEEGAFPIMQLYLRLAQQHKILAYNHSQDFWLDVGKFDKLQDVEKQIANQPLEYLS
jgi:NDP-sugar pyrophosphorylase family protein